MTPVSGDQELGMAHRSKLHYTNAVLHETMRMKTLAPFGVARKTTCDTTIGLLISLSVLCHLVGCFY